MRRPRFMSNEFFHTIDHHYPSGKHVDNVQLHLELERFGRLDRVDTFEICDKNARLDAFFDISYSRTQFTARPLYLS